ncbi:UPAR/Ly6 domain-containing protein CG9338 [Anoplolepis gracilipes]|uniref:UPAR/Ly6 domain-containing protein CG9338 n=1 Tax=Anoplolepis gracilipes TaxID=354296 RepID=UPI003BA08617
MHRRLTILLVASALVVTVYSDVLKCYMCTSLTNEGCNSSAVTTHSLLLKECTLTEMAKWQDRIKQHKVFKSITGFFNIDQPMQQHETYHQGSHMACSKMVLNVANTEVIVRTCQTAKTEVIDPCRTIKGKIQNQQLGTLEQCTLCYKDACNGATAVAPEIFYTLLSFFALVHVAFYYWA